MSDKFVWSSDDVVSDKFTWSPDDVEVAKFNEVHDELGRFASGHGAVPPKKLSDDEWDRILAQAKDNSKRADDLVAEVMAAPKQAALLSKGERKLLVSRSLDPKYAMRVTSFSGDTPLGHREYAKDDTNGIRTELYSALSGGYEVKYVKFNESHDELGRFASGASGGASPEHGEREVKYVKGVAAEVAKELGYTGQIDVDGGVPPKFTLNGMQYDYAGAANLQTGKITLYPAAMRSLTDAGGLAAHEIMHQKFEAVNSAFEAERRAVMSDTEMPKGRLGGMKPDGTLRAPYDEKYPLYTKLSPHLDNLYDLAKDDGVTDYSKSWWKAASDSTTRVTNKEAVHETLAEIARLDYTATHGAEFPPRQNAGVSPKWRAFYRDVVSTYPKVRK